MRIGVYRTCGLGDAVQMTPLLRQIRADYPDCELVVYTSENASGLFQGCPETTRVEALPLDWINRDLRNFGLFRVWDRVRREGRWDIFLSLEPGLRRALFFWKVRSRVTGGFLTRRWARLPVYTHTVFYESVARENTVHTCAQSLKLWSAVTGMADRGFGYDTRYLLDAPGELPAELPGGDYVCIAPKAGNFLNPGDTKSWPGEYWRELIRFFDGDGIATVVLGLPGDLDMGDVPAGCVNLLGKTSLVDLAKIVGRARGFVGNDSGVFHLAIGMGTPAAAFFGATSQENTGPFRTDRALVLQSGLPCVPCYRPECGYDGALATVKTRPFCLYELTPRASYPQIMQFLERSGE